jgi:hypothetical protein
LGGGGGGASVFFEQATPVARMMLAKKAAETPRHRLSLKLTLLTFTIIPQKFESRGFMRSTDSFGELDPRD